MLENRMLQPYFKYNTTDYEDYYKDLAIKEDMIYENKVNEELERKEKN